MTADAPRRDPFAPTDTPLGPPPVDRTVPGDFFRLFVRWEKLRLVYNGVLTLETLAVLAGGSIRVTGLVVFQLIILGIGANVCYCAGLVLNGYAWRFNGRDPAISYFIFALGLLAAMLLTLGSLASLGGPVDLAD